MKVGVLGSGSQGNCIAIESHRATLVLDAGFSPRTLVHRAAQVGIGFDTVVGIVLSHEHGDHARGSSRLAQQLECPIYASAGTLAAMTRALEAIETVPLEPLRSVSIGPFTVKTCRTNHDAAEPVAITVENPATGTKLGLAYDIGRATSGVRHLLRNCNCLIVEANHDDAMLRTGPYPASVRQRISGSGGHLSNRAAAQLLEDLCHQGLSTVVLVHLSGKCNRPDIAHETVARVLSERGFRGDLLIAAQRDPLPAFEVVGSGAQPFLPGFA